MPYHPFLQFHDVLEKTQQYQGRLRAISTRPVLPAIHFDQVVLTVMGLWEQLLPFLHRTWTHTDGAFTFTCQGWDRLIGQEDDVAYKELMLEFFLTCAYAPAFEAGTDAGPVPGATNDWAAQMPDWSAGASTASTSGLAGGWEDEDEEHPLLRPAQRRRVEAPVQLPPQPRPAP
ncbi:hypothetical protein L1887_15018 [Cichorium endivia]|nr:hypothetical protein L1887_15018 [Cichorium endivia]